jgi:hypothetical protein
MDWTAIGDVPPISTAPTRMDRVGFLFISIGIASISGKNRPAGRDRIEEVRNRGISTHI